MEATVQPTTYALDAHAIDWVPAGPGLSFKPLAFHPGNAGWVQFLRLDPGTVIPRHRHTGEVHALNLQGHRLILDTGQVIGPFAYVHESAGDIDSWMAVGDEPCIIHIEVLGTIEYLGPGDRVATTVDGNLQRQLYLRHCAEKGQKPQAALAGSPG